MTIAGSLGIDLPQLTGASSKPDEIHLIQTDSAASSPRVVRREVFVVYVDSAEAEGAETLSVQDHLGPTDAVSCFLYVEPERYAVVTESASTGRVTDLTSEILRSLNETGEVLDTSIRSLQQGLVEGDIVVAEELARIACGEVAEATSGNRALALDVFVAAEVPGFARLAERLVMDGLVTDNDEVQFTAVACCGALDDSGRTRAAEVVRRLLPTLAFDTQAAANAFLATMEH